jgi:ankyrin repeat protein
VPNININLVNDSNITALMFACHNKNFEIVKELLQRPEIDYNYCDREDILDSALICACKRNNKKIINELLKIPDIDYEIAIEYVNTTDDFIHPKTIKTIYEHKIKFIKSLKLPLSDDIIRHMVENY